MAVPFSPEPHWYLFAYDGTTGAEFLADRIVLHFVDGERGDNDLEANGLVVDPGAPAFSPDADGDGIPNDQDCCHNSDLRPSIWINGVNTEVANESLGDGCTLADVIAQTLATDPGTADVDRDS